jgi:hypothetical protein
MHLIVFNVGSTVSDFIEIPLVVSEMKHADIISILCVFLCTFCKECETESYLIQQNIMLYLCTIQG